MHVLYQAVAGGMWAYSNAAFKVVVLGPRRVVRFKPSPVLKAQINKGDDDASTASESSKT